MKRLKLKIMVTMGLMLALAWLGGFAIGRECRPVPCVACAHPQHGSGTCCRPVPYILGTVACTCQGMGIRPKRLLLGS